MRKIYASFILAMTFVLVMGVGVMATECPAGTSSVFVEQVSVPSSGSIVTSTSVLGSGVTYLLEASGTAFAGDTIDFDAKYSLTNRIFEDAWTDLVSGYVSYGPTLLELKANGNFVDWGAYNAAHTYQYFLTGDGNQATFDIYDVYYPNNVGALTVDIYQCADIKVHGGGHILEDGVDGGAIKRKDWFDISFGGFIGDAGALGLFGEWQINFHNVNDNSFDKSTFHTTEIVYLNLYDPSSNTCTGAMNFKATGEWNGLPGYSIIFRAGDSSDPSSYDTDTVRVTLYYPGGGVAYDSSWPTEFTDHSSCVGSARTKLDTGNIIIQR